MFIMTPFKLAFYESSEAWTLEIIHLILDGLFLLDMVITFFSAYYDDHDQIITSKKKLAFNYLKSWFFIDAVALAHLFLITQNIQGYTSLLRFLRFPKFFRLLKITM